MTKQDKHLLRLANQIREGIREQHRGLLFSFFCRVHTLQEHLSGLLRTRQQLALCQDHALWAAAQSVRTSARYTLADLRSELDQMRPSLERAIPDLPELRTIWLDLKQINDEFENVRHDIKAHVISVDTDPIELEETYLGPFRVVLSLPQLANPQRWPAYKVVALDPNPAQGNESVTHPHVSDERLCEGDATISIRAALQEGRLCDFFMLVRQVLQTYNRHSPYVSLEKWSGAPCYDCGYLMDEEESYTCDVCGDAFCNECICNCKTCDAPVCRHCSSCCSACDETLCSRCKQTCSECGAVVCGDCLTNDLCPTCREQQEEDENEQQDDSENTSDDVGCRETPVAEGSTTSA